jgi:hypothetical protein
MFHDDTLSTLPTVGDQSIALPVSRIHTPATAFLNNAATSYPKPASVIDAVVRSLSDIPRDAGRSGGSDDSPTQCRHALATLFDVRRPEI